LCLECGRLQEIMGTSVASCATLVDTGGIILSQLVVALSSLAPTERGKRRWIPFVLATIYLAIAWYVDLTWFEEIAQGTNVIFAAWTILFLALITGWLSALFMTGLFRYARITAFEESWAIEVEALPPISIVIACKNAATTLDRCLSAVIRQAYPWFAHTTHTQINRTTTVQITTPAPSVPTTTKNSPSPPIHEGPNLHDRDPPGG